MSNRLSRSAPFCSQDSRSPGLCLPLTQCACLLFKGSPARSAEAQGPNMGKLPAPALHPDQGRNSRPQTPPGKTPGPSDPRGKKGTATFAAEVTGGSNVELLGVCLHMSFGTHTRVRVPPGRHKHMPPGTHTSSGCVPGVGQKCAYVQS